jgi:DNA-binding response OmpR family regulator
LIVDASEDARDVLRTALARRGVEAYVARGPREGLEILRCCRPAVVVLDLDLPAPDDDARTVMEDELAQQPATLLVLSDPARAPVAIDHHLVRKPYHYAPLILKIEQLIEHAAHVDP